MRKISYSLNVLATNFLIKLNVIKIKTFTLAFIFLLTTGCEIVISAIFRITGNILVMV